jgi:acyl carrier protein
MRSRSTPTASSTARPCCRRWETGRALATVDDVRHFVLAELHEPLALRGLSTEDVDDDFDFRSAGVLDSIGFLDLISAIEDRFGVEVDFDDVSIDELTVVGPFCRHFAERATPDAG